MPCISDRIVEHDKTGTTRRHRAGSLSLDTLRCIERYLDGVTSTAETGCGRSTILFSNISTQHTAFCIDDRNEKDSSLSYVNASPEFRKKTVDFILGPSQATLPSFEHRNPYDAVLLDGPHGWPFPELEYFFFYPHIRQGGLLIVDDVQIPTVGRMADVLQEDSMWLLELVSGKTALFRRTDAPATPSYEDNWWTQDFNRRRTKLAQFRLEDGRKGIPFVRQVELKRRMPTRKRIKRALKSLVKK